MKILFTSDLSGLGGGEVGLLYLIDQLKQQNECQVLLRSKGKLGSALSQGGIPAHIIDYKSKKGILSSLHKVRSVIRANKPDAIISNDPVTAILMKLCSLPMKVPNYWICHGQWYKFSLTRRKLLKACVKKIFCVSHSAEQNLHAQGIDNTKVTFLGVPKDKFESLCSPERPVLLPEFRDAKKIVTIARFQKIKGQDKGVRAVSTLLSEGYDVVYYLVGGSIFGNQDDELYEKMVKDLVKQLEIQDRVFFLGERSDIPEIMREADVLLIPSDNESLGLVALEAIMSNLPIASTPNDGVCEILKCDTNMIAETNDPEGLTRILKALLFDSKVLREAKMSLNRNKEEFSVESVANQLLLELT